MPRILVVQGLGLDTRGKTQIEIFGTMTLDDYDRRVRTAADALGVEVEIVHSNDPDEVVRLLGQLPTRGVAGVIINPGGFSIGHPAVAEAVAGAGVPTVEVHISNPARRGIVSEIGRASTSAVAGFGVDGYELALRGLVALLAAE